MASENRKCAICGVVKLVSTFGVRGNICNVCRRRRAKESHSESVRQFLHMKLIKAKSRKGGHPVEVSVDYLIDIWRLQKGMCALSGLPMAFDESFPERSVSIDRIDCDKGYLVGNLRLVCSNINFMRRNMLDSEFYWWCKAVAENMYEH